MARERCNAASNAIYSRADADKNVGSVKTITSDDVLVELDVIPIVRDKATLSYRHFNELPFIKFAIKHVGQRLMFVSDAALKMLVE